MEEYKEQMCMMPLPNGKFPLTETGIISAQEDGFELGWKAAFERILDEMNTDEFKDNGELRTFIEAELKDVKPKV